LEGVTPGAGLEGATPGAGLEGATPGAGLEGATPGAPGEQLSRWMIILTAFRAGVPAHGLAA